VVQFKVFDDAGRWVHTDETKDPDVARLCTSAFDSVWELGVPQAEFIIRARGAGEWRAALDALM